MMKQLRQLNDSRYEMNIYFDYNKISEDELNDYDDLWWEATNWIGRILYQLGMY